MIYKEKPPEFRVNEIWQIFIEYNCKKILDAGCCIGWFGEYKPDRSIRVWGIDANKAAVEIAKKYEAATVGDVKELPYPDRFFDGILAFHIIEHVNENLRVMKEFYRVLKKKGILVAESPSPWCNAWEDYTHVRPYTVRSFSNLAKDAGFRIVECRYLGGDTGVWKAKTAFP